MIHFDPIENDRRIREGLLAAVGKLAVEFAKENTNLIAVFDDPFTKFSGGRIILFQEHVYNLTGVAPVFVKEIPACIKVFFRLDVEAQERVSEIFAALDSTESKEVYRSIGVSQVQYAGKLITPNP